MFKSIFKAVAVSAVAVFFCVGCGDKSDDGPDDGGNPADGGGAKSYTITFNANGGTVSPTSAKTGDDGKLASLPTPTRSGYDFDGWYTTVTGGTAVTVSNVYSANATIYARWTAEPVTPPDTTGGGGTKSSYTIKFDAWGGTVTPTSGTTDTDGKLASLPTPTRDGYTFDGWYTEISAGTKVDTSTTFSANATIYARWIGEPLDTLAGGIIDPSSVKRSTFTDNRDGKTYNIVKIGKQTWFAENLNYDVPDVTTDVCYENSADSCAKYGRLYNWNDATSACPVGFRLPSLDDWETLRDRVGGYEIAGKKLKSISGWSADGGGTDDYGFSALPGGYGYSRDDGDFNLSGSIGEWWSITDKPYTSYAAYAWVFRSNNPGVISGESEGYSKLLSVRCVQGYE